MIMKDLLKTQGRSTSTSGGSGSGKTTFSRKLSRTLAQYGVSIETISHDSYYKDISDKSFEERSMTNFDHPDSLETSLLVRHILDLRKGRAVQIPTYDFTNHRRTCKTVEILPQEIIIVEGILIFVSEELRRELDITFFLDSRPDTRLTRRISRDVEERGRSMSSVLQQFRDTVQPMHEEWVEPTKNLADFLLSGEKWLSKIAMEFVVRGLHFPLEPSSLKWKKDISLDSKSVVVEAPGGGKGTWKEFARYE